MTGASYNEGLEILMRLCFLEYRCSHHHSYTSAAGWPSMVEAQIVDVWFASRTCVLV